MISHWAWAAIAVSSACFFAMLHHVRTADLGGIPPEEFLILFLKGDGGCACLTGMHLAAGAAAVDGGLQDSGVVGLRHGSQLATPLKLPPMVAAHCQDGSERRDLLDHPFQTAQDDAGFLSHPRCKAS